MEAFLMAFDAELAPAVGQQVTLTSSNGGVAGSQIALLIARAEADFDSQVLGGSVKECELVARHLEGSTTRSYLYDPVSDLFVFDRRQDLAFQRARRSVSERNHMRLWLAPVRHEGRPVWLGQISRDVGVKLSGRLWPPTTHVIDPEVAEARFFLLQNLFSSGAVARLAFVGGAPVASPDAPARNAEGDPYSSDGLRAVFFLPDHGRERTDPVYLPWVPIETLAAEFKAAGL